MLLAANGLEWRFVRAARRTMGSGRRLRPPRTCTCTRLRPLLYEPAPSATQTACRPIRHPTDGALPAASIFAAFKLLRRRPAGWWLRCLLSERMLSLGLISTGRARPTLGWAANLSLQRSLDCSGRPGSAFACNTPSAATRAAISRQQRSGCGLPVSGRGAWAGPSGPENFLTHFCTFLLLFYANPL